MHYSYSKVLDEWECATIIKDAEYGGFSESPVSSGTSDIIKKEIRNNSRTLFYPNDSFISDLEQSLVSSGVVPKEYKRMKFSRLNNVFRIYKYIGSQYFKPHKDGSIDLADEESQLTVLVYLNTCKTGATIVYPYGMSQLWKVNKMSCVAGMALAFDHDLWHEGEEVVNETKYVLRTDAFYFKD